MSFDSMIIFLGDSLTAGNDWGAAFPECKIINLGQNGAIMAGLRARLDEAAALRPKKLFLQIGINDFFRGATPEEILAGHRLIWDELAKNLPGTKLCVQGMLPYVEAAYPGLYPNQALIYANGLLAEEAAGRTLTFIDFFVDLADRNHQLRLEYTNDGLHLLPAAYRAWEEAIRPFVADGGR